MASRMAIRRGSLVGISNTVGESAMGAILDSPTRQSRIEISRALGTTRWTLSRRRARRASGPVRVSVDASAAHIDARPRRRSRRRRPARTAGGGAQLSSVMGVPEARIWTDRWAISDFKGDATLAPPQFVGKFERCL